MFMSYLCYLAYADYRYFNFAWTVIIDVQHSDIKLAIFLQIFNNYFLSIIVIPFRKTKIVLH